MTSEPLEGGVGPVLLVGPEAGAIVAAIRATHPSVRVVDRGSYWRVSVPGGCRVTRAAIEAQLGQAFSLPSDLERVMPSFSGRLRLSADEAIWLDATWNEPGALPPERKR